MIVRAQKPVTILLGGLARTAIARRCHTIQRVAIMEMSIGMTAAALGKVCMMTVVRARPVLAAHAAAAMNAVLMDRRYAMEAADIRPAILILMDAGINHLLHHAPHARPAVVGAALVTINAVLVRRDVTGMDTKAARQTQMDAGIGRLRPPAHRMRNV